MNQTGFEYEVYARVELTLREAGFLKHVAGCHYDARVRESSQSGPINGLYNHARWHSEDQSTNSPEGTYTSKLHPRDMDVIVKALEQWDCHAPGLSHVEAATLASELTEKFQELMRRCYARRAEVAREGLL